MTIRKFLTFPDPKLREVAKEVTEFNSDLKILAEDLIETMYEFKGIGLAAVQIGVNKRVIVADVSEEKKEPFIFINPEIKILNEDEKGGYDEGCLSIPGMQGLVRRYSKIKYEGFDIDGNQIQKKAEGLHARVIQHEIDHLDGVLYTERLADKKAFGFEKEIIEYWKNENQSAK